MDWRTWWWLGLATAAGSELVVGTGRFSAARTIHDAVAGMTRRMNEEVSRKVPRTLTDGLDASARDLGAGHVGDAGAAQREARCMLEAFENAPPAKAVDAAALA
jgi:hypothetical protein